MNTINITCKAHLTESYQLQAADKLISKLKQELAAANAYIEELEERLEIETKANESDGKYMELKAAYEGLQLRYDKIDNERRQQSKMINDFHLDIYKEEKFSKLQAENAELKKCNKRYTEERDRLIYLLNKKEE